MLTLDNIYSSYGRYVVLHGISLNVEEGEIVALIGSNGAGKSTTLRTICGLQKIQKGKVIFQGKEIGGRSPQAIREMGIGLVPEGRRLFAGMTVKENLLMGAFLRHDDFRDEMEAVMDMFPIIRERSNQLAGTLSGGEQQMVAIARGLMSSPTLLLIDELSLGLAPLVVQELVAKIASLRDTGVTVILVEQDVSTALSLSDRAYVMENGQIVKQGGSDLLLRDESIVECYLGI